MNNTDKKISLLKDRGFKVPLFGANSGATKKATVDLVNEVKNNVFQNLQMLDGVAKNSEEANALKADIETQKNKVFEHKAHLEAYQESMQTILDYAHDMGRGTYQQDKIKLAKELAAGNGEPVLKDGELVINVGDKEIPIKEIPGLVDDIQLPSQNEINELMTYNFGLEDRVRKGENINLDKEQNMVEQMLLDPTDSNGNRNPKVALEKIRSMLNDTEFRNSVPEKLVDQLTEMATQGNYEPAVKAFSKWDRSVKEEIIKGAQAPAEPSQPINKPNEPSSPKEINFNDIRSVDSEISRLENMSQQERQDLDYFEGSVEGSVIERLAKLKQQKQALQSKNEMQNRSNFN